MSTLATTPSPIIPMRFAPKKRGLSTSRTTGRRSLRWVRSSTRRRSRGSRCSRSTLTRWRTARPGSGKARTGGGTSCASDHQRWEARRWSWWPPCWRRPWGTLKDHEKVWRNFGDFESTRALLLLFRAYSCFVRHHTNEHQHELSFSGIERQTLLVPFPPHVCHTSSHFASWAQFYSPLWHT